MPKSPVLSVPVILWVSDCMVSAFLWASTVLYAQRRCPMPAAAAPGSRGQQRARGCGAASPKQSSVSCSTYENKRKQGKSYPIAHPRAAGLCRRGRVGSHDRRQHSRSIPKQAQAGAVGSDSRPQVGAAVSQGSPPPTATVLRPAGPSASPAGTVTAPAPSPPRSSLNTEL